MLLLVVILSSGLIFVLLLALLLFRRKRHHPPPSPCPPPPPPHPCPPTDYKVPDNFGEADLPAALTVRLMGTPANGVPASGMYRRLRHVHRNRAGGMVLVPHGLTTEAYQQIFTNQLVMHSMLVSIGITIVGTALSMVVTVLCAYGLSRPGSFAHRPILMMLVVTMFFSGGLIPSFLLVSALGGYGEYWSLILPGAVSVFNILVMRAFFAATAQELIDAARESTARAMARLWSIVLPTSGPVRRGHHAVLRGRLLELVLQRAALPARQRMWPLQMVIYTYTLQGNSMPGTGITNTGQYAGHQQTAPLSLQMAVVTLTLIPIVWPTRSYSGTSPRASSRAPSRAEANRRRPPGTA